MPRRSEGFTFTFTLFAITREAFGPLLSTRDGDNVFPLSSILREPMPKTNAIVFYSNCNDPNAFGDFSQCGALAYEIQKYSGMPVVLTSGPADIHRFNTLYGNKAGAHQLYGAPIQVISTAEFNPNAFVVRGYVEVAWCKPNNPLYVSAIVGDTTKCAFVGTANYQAPFTAPNYTYGKLVKEGQSRNFLAGLDVSRDGVTFSSFDSFKREVKTDDLVMTVLPEKLITNARDYGLVYFKKDSEDRHFLTSYLRLFTAVKQNALIVAFGDAQSVRTAVKAYFDQATSKNKVILVDYDAKMSLIYFKRGSEPKKLHGCYEVLPEQEGVTTIVTCRSVPNLQMRRLIAGAHQFIAMTGVSSTIEAWGEKKVVVYQWGDNNAEFISSYLRSPAFCASSGMLQDFGRMLLQRQFSDDAIVRLTEYLRNKPLCDQIAALNASMIAESSEKLPARLLSWLGIPRKVVEVDLCLSGSSNLPIEAASPSSSSMSCSM